LSVATNRIESAPTLGASFVLPEGRGVWLVYDAFFTAVDGTPQYRWKIVAEL
jgi:hypothetical protein